MAGTVSGAASELGEARAGVMVAVPIPVEDIRPDVTQPRRRFLLNDILHTLEVKDGVALPGKGINEPITVRCAADGTTHYEIIKGERRWRSAVKKGLGTIHAFVVEDQLHPAEVLRRQLLENVARKDLEPLEIADAIGDFIT